MSKLSEWKIAKKIEASGKKGIVIGLAIAAVILLVVVAIVVKTRWIKKQFGCLHCDVDELNDEFCDDEECCYGTEKDFV